MTRCNEECGRASSAGAHPLDSRLHPLPGGCLARPGHRPQRLHRLRDGPPARSGRATRSSGSTPTSSPPACSATAAAEVPSLRKDLRDVEAARPRRLRRGAPPRRALQRPARQPQPAGDLRHQPPGLGPPRRARQGGRRAALPLLLLVQHLRRAGRRLPRRERRVQPGDALRRSPRCAPSATRRAGRRRASARPTCATPPPTASRRGCASTSCSTTSSATRITTGRVLIRATARRGARSSTSRTSRAPSSPRSKRPREVVHDQAFNVGATAENYRIRELAEIVAEAVPGVPHHLRRGRRPGQALLPGRLLQDRARAARLQAAVGRPPRREELHEAYRATA